MTPFASDGSSALAAPGEEVDALPIARERRREKTAQVAM